MKAYVYSPTLGGMEKHPPALWRLHRTQRSAGDNEPGNCSNSWGKLDFPTSLGGMKGLVYSMQVQLRLYPPGHGQRLILSFSQASGKERHWKKPPHAPVKPRNILCELKAWHFPTLNPATPQTELFFFLKKNPTSKFLNNNKIIKSQHKQLVIINRS